MAEAAVHTVLDETGGAGHSVPSRDGQISSRRTYGDDPHRPDSCPQMRIAAGQRWTHIAGGSTITIEAKSDLLVHWWKVRSIANGTFSIDENALIANYRLDVVAADEAVAREHSVGSAA